MINQQIPYNLKGMLATFTFKWDLDDKGKAGCANCLACQMIWLDFHRAEIILTLINGKQIILEMDELIKFQVVGP